MKKKVIFALFLAFGFKFNHSHSQNYFSSSATFSVTDTAKIWSKSIADSLSYVLIEINNELGANMDISFEWAFAPSTPNLWMGAIEYPSSNGYTSQQSGQFRLRTNGSSQHLIFFAFAHQNQLGTGVSNLHLYNSSNTNDSLNIRFQMTALANPLLLVENTAQENSENSENSNMLHVFPNPSHDMLHVGLFQTLYQSTEPRVTSEAIHKVEIYNLLAQKIEISTVEMINYHNNGLFFSLDISQLPQGSYLLKIGKYNRFFIKY
jgi:Secretion system C-terminal sorting domain